MSNVIFDMAGKDDISELVRLRIAYMIDDFGSISEYERQCMEEQIQGFLFRADRRRVIQGNCLRNIGIDCSFL